MLRFCVPIQVRSAHLCFPCNKCVAMLLFPFNLWLLGPELRKKMCIHVGGGPKELLMDLSAYGMEANGIPPAVGGSFDLTRYGESLDQRLALETSRQRAAIP
jgi:hypothetical protein